MKESALSGALCAVVFSLITLPSQASRVDVLSAKAGDKPYQAHSDWFADPAWHQHAKADNMPKTWHEHAMADSRPKAWPADNAWHRDRTWDRHRTWDRNGTWESRHNPQEDTDWRFTREPHEACGHPWDGHPGKPSAVPVPAAVWLFGSGLLGLLGISRRKKAA